MSINFRERLKSTPSEQDEHKSRNIDGYRSFIFETMPGYIAFLEALNHTITELEIQGIVGKVSLRSRVKALNSALINTDIKTLDDIFGFEIVAENERDKEILMVIIHNIFSENTVKHKNHNKSNGYFAHHCTGAVRYEFAETDIQEHILNAKTEELKPEYRDMPKKEQQKFSREEIFLKKPRYPTLRQEIIENEGITDELQENLAWSLWFIDEYLNGIPELRRNMPVCEIQFKTQEVEYEAKHGKAQHMGYKKVDKEKIVQAYFDRKLVRGVNFPFIFIRNDEGDLEIEHTSKTLINMWPFMVSVVEKYHQNSCPVANYDMYFAKVFPALEPYVQNNPSQEYRIPTGDSSLEKIWSILKNKIMNDSFVLPDSDRFFEPIVIG